MNSRLDSVQAAILLAKLPILDDEIARRQAVADRYDALFEGIEGVISPHIAAENLSVYAQYTVMISNRDEVQRRLAESGIPTAVHYPVPLNRQPAVADEGVMLPVGDAAANRVISLPMHPYLSEEDQRTIVAGVQSALADP
jgi:UDP-2-acetamido-2-deoxy-ribo-hexuluronate aminotransferase